MPASNAIPSKRLSFITSQDQQNFSQLFASAVGPNETAMSGDVARTVLMRSQLPTNLLGDIWQLADTNRSGSLLFPEFCLAMYLCGAALRGEKLPSQLHPGLKKEVTDIVDEISFGVPDTQQNEFDRLQQAALQSQQTGYQQSYVQPQQTGYGFQQQQTGFQPQQTGYQSNYQNYQQPQQTGFQSYQQPQQTGFQQSGYQSGYNQPLQPQLTGGPQPQQMGLQSQPNGPLQAQLTGGPLQPQVTGGYQGLQSQQTGPIQPQLTGGPLQPQVTGGYSVLQSQQTGPLQPQITGGAMQPQMTGPLQPQITGGAIQPQQTGPLQPQLTGGQLPAYLSAQPTGKPGQWGFSNAAAPGIEQFRNVFTTTQPQVSHQNEIRGNNQVGDSISKTEKSHYDEIFTFWDKNRTGFIDGPTALQIFGNSGLDRKDLEAIWNLADPKDRGRLGRDEFAVAMHLIYRRLNGYDVPLRLPPELQPPSSRHLQDSLNQMKQFLQKPDKPNKSYMKSNSFASNAQKFKQDATVYKNNDDEQPTYRSANRHKAPPKPTSKPLSKSATSLSELSKQIKEKKILLEALNAQDEEEQEAQRSIEADNIKAIADLKDRIRIAQKSLADSPSYSGGSSSIERRQLMRKLEDLTDALPQLTSSIRKVEQDISLAKVELAHKQYLKQHPGLEIKGSGPNGTITEHDRATARRKAELRARMSAITGKQSTSSGESFEDFERCIAQAQQSADQERDTNEQSLRALEESVRSVKRDLEMQLRESPEEVQSDRDRRRWEEAIGVEPSVKDFILELRSPKPTAYTSRQSTPTTSATSSRPSPAPSEGAADNSSATKKETPAERVARIKAEANRRLQEKMAAAGLQMRGKRGSPQVTPQSTGTANSASPPSNESPKPTKPPHQSDAHPHPPNRIHKPETPAAPAQAPKPSIEESPKVAKTPAHEHAATKPQEDEEDEEERELKRQLEEQEKRLKEMELQRRKKKEEKARRMAQLAKQQEELRLREQSLAKEDDDDWDGHVAPAATYKPQSQPKTIKPQSVSRSEPASKPEPSPKAAHPSNPTPVKTEPSPQQNSGPDTISVPEAVSKSGTQVPQAESAEQKGSDTRSKASFNPFTKSHPAPPSSEAKTSATVAQPLATKPNPFGPRPATSNDEDWGSDDNESEDEDRPSGRANPTQLASLLFGTMGGPIRPQATGGSGTPSRPDSAAAVNAPQRRTQPEVDSGLLKNAGTDPSNFSYPTPNSEPSNEPPPVPATTNAEHPNARPPVPASYNYEHAQTFNPPPVPTSHDQVYAEPFSAPPPPPSGNNLEVPSYSYAADSESEFESADEGPSEPTSLPPPPPPPGVAPPPAPAPPPPPLAAPTPPTNSTGGAPGVSGGLGALLGDITKGTTLRRTPKESLQESSLGRVV